MVETAFKSIRGQIVQFAMWTHRVVKLKAAPNENWYHRGKGQIDNEKYYHKITGQEVVFDKNGKIVTDHENIGTKNYGTNPKSWEHVKFDVIPYYIWGNSPEDTTPLFRRIFGYH